MKRLFQKVRGFFNSDERGSLSVEAVFAFPMLFWAATATFTFYDAYKAQNTSYRANYTISDMLSRETNPVNQNYIDGLNRVFRYMTHTGPESSWIRVSVVQCTANCGNETTRELSFVWSHSASGARSLTSADVPFYKTKIPLLPAGDRLILVETSRQYIPPFASALVSFAERNLVSHVVTRPRFAPQLLWSNS
jgi:hypothetical protein